MGEVRRGLFITAIGCIALMDTKAFLIRATLGQQIGVLTTW
jgi:hypothetical protein